ncbi:MAG: hypothetical protein GY711_15860 [bacterium]|nr:hypothetical protein [bacterium]
MQAFLPTRSAGVVLAATIAPLLAMPATAQLWADNFDSYPAGAPVDPGGQASIGNGWESWSSGLPSSTVAGQPPAPAAYSAPNSLQVNTGVDTVNNFNDLSSHPTAGRWTFTGQVYHPSSFVFRSTWLMMNTYNFGGPYGWSVQVHFNGNTNMVECACQFTQVDQPLIRNTWVPIRAEVDLDNDSVDLFYNGQSLTGGQTYVWTMGPNGTSNGLLEIQALDLFPNEPGSTEMYYDDLLLMPDFPEIGVSDPVCQPLSNSNGSAATIELTGLALAGQRIYAKVYGGVPDQFGYFIGGPNPGLYIVPPGSSGIVCIGSPQYRFNGSPNVARHLFRFDAFAESQHVVNGGPVVIETNGSFPGIPPVGIGSSWSYQAWYRDVAPFGSNFSDSRRVSF